MRTSQSGSGYAYVDTRIKAMKSLLLPTDIYPKLLKMSLDELIRFLEDRTHCCTAEYAQPRVTEIPGNRPEDLEWNELWDWIADTDISPLALQALVLGWCKRNQKPPRSEPRLKPKP